MPEPTPDPESTPRANGSVRAARLCEAIAAVWGDRDQPRSGAVGLPYRPVRASGLDWGAKQQPINAREETSTSRTCQDKSKQRTQHAKNQETMKETNESQADRKPMKASQNTIETP